MSDDEPYNERLRRLRTERGLSRGQLHRLTREVGIDMLIALERDPESGRARYPSAATLEDVAQALDVPAEDFPEYRLARAREELDERVVGIGRALVTLSALEDALRERADRGLADAAAQPRRSRRRRRATGTEGRNPPGAGGHGI
jgi:transcriptional regulator with XRE-family HTH domain